MHLLLTDILTCPRCGPSFGLVLLAERIEERRVLEGWLGCPNCRERYPVRGGFADLRPPAERGPAPAPPRPGSADQAFRLAALLGVTAGPGYVLVAGDEARLAPGIADTVDGIEVVTLSAPLAGWPERDGVSRLAAGGGLPFFDATLRAVALTAGARAGPEEAARVLVPGGRLVWEGAGTDGSARLDAAGLRLMARQAATLVAARP